jgi:NitT/TauT family transport system substrate-binding protein
MIASGKFARTRPEDSAKLIRAHQRACRFIAEHPIDALAIAVRYTGMTRDTITEAMAHMRYSPEIDREKVSEFAAFLSELHYLSPDRANRQLEFFNAN